MVKSTRNPDRQIDKTFLSLNNAEERGLVHRDYIAHCLRWSHVVRELQRSGAYKDAVVLDVGCGKELPLAKLLYVNKMTPKKYIGVDCNKLTVPEMLAGKGLPLDIWSETDFCALDPIELSITTTENGAEKQVLPNTLVCFEVLEHVTPEHCRRMLEHFKRVTSDDCHYFISTPCWNGSAAQNHINEMSYDALGSLFEDLNYKIQGVYGTFASISDYKDQLGAVELLSGNGSTTEIVDLRSTFNALRGYYDTNVLSVIFAPLFPASSRNCLWHLTKDLSGAEEGQLFQRLGTVPGPWSQHPRWRELAAMEANNEQGTV